MLAALVIKYISMETTVGSKSTSELKHPIEYTCSSTTHRQFTVRDESGLPDRFGASTHEGGTSSSTRLSSQGGDGEMTELSTTMHRMCL